MVFRTLKNIIRARLRKQAKELRIPLEEPYRRTVVDLLNLVFATDSTGIVTIFHSIIIESLQFWRGILRKKLVEYFPDALTKEELESEYPLRVSKK
jgi:hypothetical protein